MRRGVSVLALLAALAGSGTPAAAQGAADEGAGGGPAADTLSLEGALRRALSENPDVDASRAGHVAAGVARWADWGAFLPTASASQSFSRTSFTRVTFEGEEGVVQELPEPISDVSKTASGALSLRWDVLDGGSRFFDLRSGAAAERAAGFRVAEAERTVVARVRVAYYEALKAQRLVEIARTQLENRRQDLVRTRQRFRLAVADRRDVLGAEFEVRRAELSLVDARNAAAARRRELRAAMGRNPGAADDRVLREPPPAPDPGGLTVDAAVERALAANPELRRLGAEIDRASAAQHREWTRYLPRISLSYSESRAANAGAPGDFFQFDLPNTSDNVRLSASWELFGGFARREATARARAEERRVRAERRARRLEIERRVRDGVDEVHRRAERLELLREQFRTARERLALSREGYRAGTVTFDELQRAIDERTASERDVIRERFDYLVAWARLEEDAGAELR